MAQNLIDFSAAIFLCLLFSSLYRKRRTPAIRCWLSGWLFVLIHFAALLCKFHSTAGAVLQDLVSVGALVLCATSFFVSRNECRNGHRDVVVGSVLALPWLGAVLFACWPRPWLAGAVGCAFAAAIAVVVVGLRLFNKDRLQLAMILVITAGCVVWLAFIWRAGDLTLVLEDVLTQSFGLSAILLTFGRRKLSVATAITSVGAVAWGSVWVTGALVAHFAPTVASNPELWNLPKYFVALGMILTLLEQEIYATELSAEQYKLLFTSNPQPMWMYDPDDLRLLQVNKAAIAQYGFSEEQFRTMTLLDVLGEEPTALVVKRLQQPQPQPLSGPWRHRRVDGSTLQVDVCTQPILQDGCRITFAMMHDVTERQQLHAQLLRQAQRDVLTDLPNRALFDQHLQEALAHGAQFERKVAIFCLDLDRLKQVNDSFGHAAGDLCLKEVAHRLTRRLGERGTVARTGGDEFMLLLGDLHQPEQAEEVAAALVRELKAAVPSPCGDLAISGSIGLALYPDDAVTTEQLWRDADAAMYQAKQAGGAQWLRVSSEISSSASQAKEIELGLRRALRSNDFELVYQPQMTLDGRLHSMEALMRSRDPALWEAPTDRIIAIAEESGLILALGSWVLDEVCRQCRAWSDEGLPPLQIAVNVSPLQLMRFDFSRQVSNLLTQHGLSPSRLELEVTESTMMTDRGGNASQQIATLAEMGIRFSVDDFGTGYSSFGRLHQLPVNSLKIDRSFISRIAEVNGTYPTVEAIIVMAHTFGMKVVAEGVETQEQVRLLKALQCDRVQGFLFSTPLSRDAATALLRSSVAELQHAGIA